jgi:predicted  nucleic acid-binding Zn-ribbon protein
MDNKKIDNIEKLVEIIATNVLNLTGKVDNIEKKMATKEDLTKLDLKLTTEIQDFRSDFKSYKKDTEHDIKEIKDDVVELDDTTTHYDKRIEKLENKFFV